MALLAGGFVYVLHHLPRLGDHAVLTLLAVLGLAAAGAALIGGGLASRVSRQPIVVVTEPDPSQITPLTKEDLDFCTELHTAALGHGFFVSMGPGILREYLRSFFDSPYAIAMGSTIGGHRVGFLVGVLYPQRHARWVLRHRGVRFALRALGALALRPLVAARFLRGRLGRYASFWRRHRGSDWGQPATAPKFGSEPAVLSHVAVVDGARGTGAGKQLVRSFEATAGSSGARWATLTTLAGDEGAGSFYSELGWRRLETRTASSGETSEEWATNLGEGGPLCAD